MGGPYFLGAGPLLIDSASASYFLNGNVGIGRSDPAHALDIVGNVRLLNQGTLFWRNAANDSDWGEITFWSDNSLYLGFNAANVRVRTGGEVRLTVDASGNVGIGTDTPTAKLHVAGDLRVDGTIQGVVDSSLGIRSQGSGQIELNNNNGATGSFIWYGGGVSELVAFYSSNPGAGKVAGEVRLEGPIGKIYGRSNVGLAANGFDDLIVNYGNDNPGGGVVYFQKGNQGGGAKVGGTTTLRIDPDGSIWAGSPIRKVIDAQGRALYA